MLLNHRSYFVQEEVAFVELTDAYHIFDPETGQRIGVARDEPATWAKYLRLLVRKGFLPTTVQVYESEAPHPVLTLRKKPGILRSRVVVTDASGLELGRLESKIVSLGGGFRIYDTAGMQVAEVKGDWKGWNFRFLDAGGHEIGVVTKKWGGIGKELFTTADSYMIALSETAPSDSRSAALLLAAGLAIDIVFKERSG